MDDLKNIIESLLFVAEEPLSIEQINQVLSLPDTKTIRQALNELIADYERRQGAFTLHEVAGGYQFRSRPDYVPWIRRLLQPKPSRLSKAALETLAIIAYKQPMIRSDVEHLRGVDCGGVLRMLLERKLIRVLGRKEIPGRPLIYATTKQFLQVFDLKNLKDLPSPKEIEALGIEAMDTDNSEDEIIDAAEPEDDTTHAANPQDHDRNTPLEAESDPEQKELDEEPPDSL
ncbi:SMC-Scp complex subunit ScpB [Thermodesulfobacteriota bacterium]